MSTNRVHAPNLGEYVTAMNTPTTCPECGEKHLYATYIDVGWFLVRWDIIPPQIHKCKETDVN